MAHYIPWLEAKTIEEKKTNATKEEEKEAS